MATRYKGVRMGGAIKPANMGNMKVQKAVDFIQLAERGLITQSHEKTSTSGAGHKKSSDKFGSSISSSSVDMGEISGVQAISYDYGSIATAALTEETDRWAVRRAVAASLAVAPGDPVIGPWTVNLANVTYDNVSFSLAGQMTDSGEVHFNPDGTIMYGINYATSKLYQYTLTTGFDLSTAAYANKSLTLGVSNTASTPDSGPQSIFFNNDGTTLFVMGLSQDRIQQFSLSTAYDISTASFIMGNFFVGNQATSPSDLSFNPDGTIMYVTCYATNKLYQYTLTTAFDITTASYTNKSFSYNPGFPGPTGTTFNNAGTKVYVVSYTHGQIFEYSVATAYDVSTIINAIDATYNFALQGNNPYDLAFSADGKKMFVVSITENAVFQYSTGL